MACVLDGKLDEILEMVISGDTLQEIATKFNCVKSVVSRFLSQKEHSARAHEAYTISAMIIADKAIEVLKDEKVDIARARELASHYRWEAKMRDRNRYGDKSDITSNNQPINSGNDELLKLIASKINA